jgi:hypothetical protein
MTNPETGYTVMVDDNYHYMDADERYKHGDFATAAEAIAAARKIVDAYLASAYEPGMSATALYSSYTSFGEDPFIVAPGEAVEFSAWTYAKARSEEMCRDLKRI